MFTLLVFNSLVKESYTQALHQIPNNALHIETTSLVDRTYELIQEPDEDFSEAQVNSDSEEPQHTDSIDTSTGKPRCIILLFQIMQLMVIFLLCI